MCELCDMVESKDYKTHLYHVDNICTIVDCLTCGPGNPMIVLNHHGEPTEKELEHMKAVSIEQFPDKVWRGYRRKIQDHWHEHLIAKATESSPLL